MLARAHQQHPDGHIEEILAHQASRRRFLKTSLQTGLVAGIGGPQVLLPFYQGAFKPKVVIVGAGLSGLTAAHYLRKKGIDPVIYESDKRMGGRIKSTHRFGNGQLYTELGAEFIDSNHKDLFHLIRDLGLKNKVMDTFDDKLDGREWLYVRGQKYSLLDLVQELNSVYPQIIADKNRLHIPEESAKFDQISVADYIDRMPVSLWVQSLLNSAFTGENGLETSEQSALIFLTAFGAKTNAFNPFGESDERYKIMGGNEQIITALAQKVGADIRFEHRLEGVRENADGSVRLTFNQGGGRSLDETVDAVILTLPFTILRNIDFAVSVCDEKCQAIQELSYGANTKFILETNQRIWRAGGSLGFMFNEVVHNGWDSSQMQNGNSGTGTYTVFLGGEEAKKAAVGTEARQLSRCMPVLNQAFPGFEHAYSGQNQLAYWPGNPHVYASYSCFSIGQITRFAGQAFAPVGNIYFAGEHCSDDFWGYMNGAAETGRKAAELVLKKALRQ
jgi:monoamine oxidase